jgi:DMSO/TMAO reductase YedYZ molybdopterin-dependent catalytic subunit
MSEGRYVKRTMEDRRSIDAHRRRVVGGVAALGAAAGMAGGWTGRVLAQASAAAEKPVPGAIANADVMKAKDASVKVLSDRPLTASAVADQMHEMTTPTAKMFVRNNLLTPDIEYAAHRLKITGLVERELEFSVDELKRMANASLQAMVECAGSGRTAFQPVPRGTPWPATGGMGCPLWNGVPLREVLQAAGLRSGAQHVAFIGADFGALASVAPMIRSIPIAKAMEENTLLAWGMNGAPLPGIHGFPLRSVVHGWVGSASGKWLKEVRVLDAQFQGTFMDDSYRVPPYAVAPGERMPAGALVTTAWPVKSMMTAPAPGTKYRTGQTVLVEGKAWAGDFGIRRVEISTDEGVTWQAAQLSRSAYKYAWFPFSFEWRAQRRGFITFLARATDTEGNTQPLVAPWNPLGYFWNGVHRLGIVVEAA